MTPKK